MLCGNTFEDWRMMMFLLHCGVGCQERWSRPCTMSRHGPRYFDVQPVELLPICSNRKAEMISKRSEAGCVSLHGHEAPGPQLLHTQSSFLCSASGEAVSSEERRLHSCSFTLQILYMSALCVRTFYSLLFGCLCVHNNTLLNTSWVDPRFAASRKTPELKSPEMSGKTSLKTDELWLLDEMISLIAQLITIWSDGKNSKTYWLQTSLLMCSRNSCFKEKSNKKYTIENEKNMFCTHDKSSLWSGEKKYPHRWISAGLIKMKPRCETPLWLAPHQKPINNSQNERERRENITSLLLSVYKAILLLIKILCFIE